MTHKTILAIAACAAAAGAQAASYQAAATRYREADMVFVIVGNEFFSQPADKKSREFSAFKACAKDAKLAGDVVLVTNFKGKLNYYADSRWTKFLQPVEWKWVKDRVNTKVNCR